MTESETGYIYTLSDPRSEEVRYVGATRQPEQRLESHINRPHSDDLESWVSSLEEADREPEMNIIDVAEVAELSRVEREAIEELSGRFELLNSPGETGYRNGWDTDAAPPGESRMMLSRRDQEVLRVLATGRANPYLIREETGLNKGDTNTVLNRLGRSGHIEQVTRGLYKLTEKGREEIEGDKNGSVDDDRE
jgi:predicted transcriptional regulator